LEWIPIVEFAKGVADISMVPLIGIQGSRFPALIAEWDQLGEQFQK
jgi:hypothetical protein